MASLETCVHEFGEFRLDEKQCVLWRGLEPVPLTPKAFGVLLLLVRKTGEVISKDELMRTVWPGSFVEESNLTQTVFMLRKALGETPHQRYIVTLQGRGYRFVGDVKNVSAARHPVDDGPADLGSGAAEQSEKRHYWKLRLLLAGTLSVILGAGIFTYRRESGGRTVARGPQARIMLAVLPFQNLTGDAGQEYFSDSMTEEMTTQLGNLNPQQLGVIARTSVMHYKGSQQQIEQIGRELGVQYVLEGSVRRDSGKVRITAQLIRVSDQTHIWAQEYDRELGDLLLLQEDIAHNISNEIPVALAEHKADQFSPPAQLSLQSYEAYDLYLKGQYFYNKRTLEGFERAIDYFQQAIAKDPNHARSYAGLADTYALLRAYSGRPQPELMSKARTAALKALALDESLPEAHTVLALIVQNYDWDWQTAEKEFRRAIELNPNYATGHHWYAEHLMWRGRFEAALQESERARQLDPLSLIIAADNGAILFFSRQYDQAIAKWRSVLEMDPDFSRAHLIIAAYIEKGMLAEALVDVQAHRPLRDSPWYWADLASIHTLSGHKIQAQNELAHLLELNRRNPIDPLALAAVYTRLGNTDQALAWLEKAYVQHSDELITIKVNPVFDRFRNEDAFREVERKVGLMQ